MFALIALLPIFGGSDDDVTKIPVDKRIAYTNQLADRFSGPNAWEHYRDALASQVNTFDLSGADWDSPRAKGLWHVSSNMQALAECERWTTAESGAIHELLNANRNTLNFLAKAAQRQRFFRPLPDNAGRLHKAVTDPGEVASLLGLAKLMLLAANDHALKGDWDLAYMWNTRVHHMANQLYQQVHTFNQFEAMRVETLACRQTLCFLRRNVPESLKGLIERVATGRDRRCPDELNERAEDLWEWDWIEAWHEWARDPAQHPGLSDMIEMHVGEDDDPLVLKAERVMRDLFDGFQYKSAADLREAIRGTTIEEEWRIHCRVIGAYKRWNSRPFHDAWRHVEQFERECCDLMKMSPALSMFGCGPMMTSDPPLATRSVEILYDGVRISAAVLDYKHRHGRLPSDLDQLTPGFIDKLPDDPFSGGPYVYRVVDDGADFVLYSVWTDQTDRGGKRTDEMRVDGDFVIWPPRPSPRDE